MKRTRQKLTFHKKAFRMLEPRELARIKGGQGEGEGEGDGDGEMVLGGELGTSPTR